jgi:hypothetical protein
MAQEGELAAALAFASGLQERTGPLLQGPVKQRADLGAGHKGDDRLHHPRPGPHALLVAAALQRVLQLQPQLRVLA